MWTMLVICFAVFVISIVLVRWRKPGQDHRKRSPGHPPYYGGGLEPNWDDPDKKS